MSWQYQNQPLTALPDCEGFVYRITNLQTNEFYIGRKTARFKKTTYKMVTLKNGNKKRKRHVTYTESDWLSYWGSNTRLKSDINRLGTTHFRREILHFCHSKGQLNYLELVEQVQHRCLERADCYNEWISVKVGRQK